MHRWNVLPASIESADHSAPDLESLLVRRLPVEKDKNERPLLAQRRIFHPEKSGKNRRSRPLLRSARVLHWPYFANKREDLLLERLPQEGSFGRRDTSVQFE